jgi:hypothetical protein
MWEYAGVPYFVGTLVEMLNVQSGGLGFQTLNWGGGGVAIKIKMF